MVDVRETQIHVDILGRWWRWTLLINKARHEGRRMLESVWMKWKIQVLNRRPSERCTEVLAYGQIILPFDWFDFVKCGLIKAEWKVSCDFASTAWEFRFAGRQIDRIISPRDEQTFISDPLNPILLNTDLSEQCEKVSCDFARVDCLRISFRYETDWQNNFASWWTDLHLWPWATLCLETCDSTYFVWSP